VLETAGRVTGKKISYTIAERRAGDPAKLIGSSEKATRELGWKPLYADLEAILETAWRWLKDHPHGY
jgi:UDP-glucose 4-epimerase